MSICAGIDLPYQPSNRPDWKIINFSSASLFPSLPHSASFCSSSILCFSCSLFHSSPYVLDDIHIPYPPPWVNACREDLTHMETLRSLYFLMPVLCLQPNTLGAQHSTVRSKHFCHISRNSMSDSLADSLWDSRCNDTAWLTGSQTWYQTQCDHHTSAFKNGSVVFGSMAHDHSGIFQACIFGSKNIAWYL